MRGRAIVLSLGFAAAACGTKKGAVASDLPPVILPADAPGTYARLKTSSGDILLRLLKDEAPLAVENFVQLAKGEKEWKNASGKPVRKPLYDGTKFFRVTPGFVIQGGDPTNTGRGGPGYTINDEIYAGRGFRGPGMVAMASSAADGAGSQFFISLAPLPWLEGKHTVFAEVVEGLEVARAISEAPRLEADPATGEFVDEPKKPQILLSVKIEER